LVCRCPLNSRVSVAVGLVRAVADGAAAAVSICHHS